MVYECDATQAMSTEALNSFNTQGFLLVRGLFEPTLILDIFTSVKASNVVIGKGITVARPPL